VEENVSNHESQRFAEPLPAMRGRYMIRNPRSARIILALDGLLELSQHWQRRRPLVPTRPQRILVSDWTHVGNILLALPTLHLLRTFFPEAEIGFLTGSWARMVIEGTGLCDHLHLIDHFRLSRSSLDGLGKMRRYLSMRSQTITELRQRSYDVAIDLSSHFPPVSPIFFAADIAVRAGFTSGGFGPLLTHPVTWVHARRPMSDYPRDLLVALWPQQEIAADALLPCYPGHPRAPLPAELRGFSYTLVHMGTGAVLKEWPEEHWMVLMDALVSEGLHLVFAGAGARERDRAVRLAGRLPAGAATLLIDRPWPEFVAVVAAATHVICLDSSTAHLAAAFGVATTSLYSGMTDIAQWGPVNPRARVLANPVGCAPCYRSGGCEAMACIRGVTPDQVIDAVHAARP
jgi:ADP-heptose:LPS heptosyltransferase